MRDDLCEIAVVVDESGSMDQVRADAIGGFNSFLTEQQALPGAANLTLVKFNTAVEKIYDGSDIKGVKPLDESTYHPDGFTALYDAVGETIDSIGRRLSAMPEDQRPGKVVVAILTDGQENSSKKYTQSKIKEMVDHQTGVYSWNFMFLGANQDAWASGGAIGISNCLQYAANPAGTRCAYGATSNYVKSIRTAGSAVV